MLRHCPFDSEGGKYGCKRAREEEETRRMSLRDEMLRDRDCRASQTALTRKG